MNRSGFEQAVAEIDRLAAALPVALTPQWRTHVARFSPWLDDYCEYQLAIHSGSLALVTLGTGAGMRSAIAEQLEACGGDGPARQRFQAISRRLPGATWGCKLTMKRDPSLSVYARTPLPVPRLTRWLQAEGVSPATIDRVAAAAAILQKDHTHFLGVDFARSSGIAYQIYFTQWIVDRPATMTRLAQLADLLDLPADMAALHPHLAQTQRTIWVSFGLADGVLDRSIKVDYPDVDLATLVGLADALSLDAAQCRRLLIAQETLGVRFADYAGVRWKGGGGAALSVYLTRR